MVQRVIKGSSVKGALKQKMIKLPKNSLNLGENSSFCSVFRTIFALFDENVNKSS